MPDTNITNDIVDIFRALISGKCVEKFALFSCFVNGEPATAIVVVNKDKEGEEYSLAPVFVTVTPGMKLVDHRNREPDKKGEPKNEDV